jgi:DNA polymerase III delta subunit
MILLLFGENSYTLRLALEKFLERFRSEAAPGWKLFNCDEEEGGELFTSDLGARSLFSVKDFYIVRYPSKLPDSTRALLKPSLKRWSEDDSVVVFFDGVVPKSNKIFADIKAHASKSDEHMRLSGNKLSNYIHEELEKNKVSVGHSEKVNLSYWYEKDIERFYSELEKVLLGGVAARCEGGLEDNELFLLGDAWGKRQKASALILYQRLIESGFEPVRILRTLMWHVKNLNYAIRGKSGDMKPYVAGKAKEQARNFDKDELSEHYEVLLRMSDPRGSEYLDTKLLRFLLS